MDINPDQRLLITKAIIELNESSGNPRYSAKGRFNCFQDSYRQRTVMLFSLKMSEQLINELYSYLS